jgi:hypothetical protein
MIAIFQTNVASTSTAQKIIRGLIRRYDGYKITIDVQDQDHILRIEGADFRIEDIIAFITSNGFKCSHLPIEWDGYPKFK